MRKESNLGTRRTSELVEREFSKQDVRLGPSERFEVPPKDFHPHVERLRLLWAKRAFLFRAAALGFVVATATAFLIANRYTSSARLMPPENESGPSLAMLAATFAG